MICSFPATRESLIGKGLMLLTISWWIKVPISESVFRDLITPKYSVHLAGFLFSPHGCFVLPGGWLACTKMQIVDCKGDISLKHHHQKHSRNKDLFSQKECEATPLDKEGCARIPPYFKFYAAFFMILDHIKQDKWGVRNTIGIKYLCVVFFVCLFFPGLLSYILIFLVCLFSPPTAFMGVLFFTILTSTDIELVLQISYNSQEE